MKKTAFMLVSLLCCVVLLGCAKSKKDVVEDIDYQADYSCYTDAEGYSICNDHYNTNNPRGIIGASYRAVDNLLKIVKDVHLYQDKPILVASFVNVDDVQASSTFGRAIAEQFSSRIAQHGHKVIEVKMRTNSLFVQEHTGELMLSRELRDISLQHDAFAVLVGTYAESKRRVYLTAKLVQANSSIILSSYDYELPIGPDVKSMLQNKQRYIRSSY
jgi:TolB-like protein